MSISLFRRRPGRENSSTNCINIVLYASNTPVVTVEQGTTLGLTKRLYEALGQPDEILGLRERDNSKALACIITQDQTVLTAPEYDIILHGKSNERCQRRLDGSPKTYEDKTINTDITLKPAAQIWPVYSFPHTSHIMWEKGVGSTLNVVAAQEEMNYLWDKRGLTANTTTTHQLRQDLPPRFVYMECHDKELREADERNEITPLHSPQNTTSPSATSTGSSTGSIQDSPPQFKQSHKTPKKKWQCSFCKKFFVCWSAYNNHQRTHTGEKPFTCRVCGRSFGHQGNLKQHMHIHKEIKPHICDYCGRGFTRSNRLRDHRKSHQYEVYMHAKVAMTSGAQSTPGVKISNVIHGKTFDESATSDDNQSPM